jgi:hypothetical protein
MRAFWSIALYVSHRPTASFPAKHSNPRRTPRVHKTPGQWQDSKYAQTTVSFPPFRPRSFKPRIPHLSLFLPSISCTRSLLQLPHEKKIIIRSTKILRWFRIFDPVRAPPDRMREAEAAAAVSGKAFARREFFSRMFFGCGRRG